WVASGDLLGMGGPLFHAAPGAGREFFCSGTSNGRILRPEAAAQVASLLTSPRLSYHGGAGIIGHWSFVREKRDGHQGCVSTAGWEGSFRLLSKGRPREGAGHCGDPGVVGLAGADQGYLRPIGSRRL